MIIKLKDWFDIR